jgi:hypothetical protein
MDRAVAVAAPHDQVGDRLQAVGLHLGGRHRVLLGLEAERLQQFGGALGMRRVVARRRVGGHAHQLLQEAHLLVEVGVDPGVERSWSSCQVSLASCSSRWRKACTAQLDVVAVVLSSGLWLMPEFWPRTNSMACGITSCSFIASWPAPLGMRYSGTPSAHGAFPALLPRGMAGRRGGAHGLLGGPAQAAALADLLQLLASTSATSASRCGVVGRAQVQRELAAARHHVGGAAGHVQDADGADRVAVARGALLDEQRQFGDRHGGIAPAVHRRGAGVAGHAGHLAG